METPASLLERLRYPAPSDAWDRFVRLYTPFIFHWARQTGLQTSDAADLVQEVLTCLLQKLPEFNYDGQRSFRSWLRAVTLNKWRDQCRRRASQRLHSMGDDLAELPDPGPQDSLETEYQQHLAARALELMRAEFQPATWQACWEFVACGRPAADVAQQLGVSENAVYLAKGRVLRRLREELAGLLD